jgi:Flp pilus assembly protein TadD
LEQGDTGKGLAALKMASEAAGDDASLAEEMGEVLLSAGLNDDAARAFNKAVRLDPAKVHIYNRLGIAYRRQKRYPEAIREYQRALLVKPDDENLHFNLAVAQAEAGQFDQAKKTLAQALGLRPDFLEARDLLTRLGQ